MILPKQSSRAIPIVLAMAAAAFCWSTEALAQATAAPTAVQPAPVADGDTVRLTDEQRLAILDHITPESAAAARGERPGAGIAGLGIHGEIGAEIGSHGSHAVYGVAEIPLGDGARATVSFESSRFGSYRR